MVSNKQEKIAVITGAGGTLCSEMARSLAGQGMKVALLGRDIEKLKIVEHQIKSAGGTAISVSADVANLEAVEKARNIIVKELGFCNILINGAGGNQTQAVATINEFDPKELEEPSEGFRGFFNLDMPLFKNVIEVNTMGTVIPCQVFGKDMAENGGGSIVNIASLNSYRPLSRVAAYAMAKAGIANFTQWLAAYLAPANIRVNAIAPGFFLNDRSQKLLMTEDGGYTDRGAGIIRQTPMKHFGVAPELIGCLNWLIDDASAGFVTGIVVPVDGGFLANAGI
ncbi:MAG: SDR family NAD(P)-dependent oxidoreductase [Ferruginibacter sp.]|nr:SDR family NAD(P)-dependent oxidoreductase [Ferruginibacter sp.]